MNFETKYGDLSRVLTAKNRISYDGLRYHNIMISEQFYRVYPTPEHIICVLMRIFSIDFLPIVFVFMFNGVRCFIFFFYTLTCCYCFVPPSLFLFLLPTFFVLLGCEFLFCKINVRTICKIVCAIYKRVDVKRRL